MALNAKKNRFVEEYPVDLNATQAAIRAGYSKKTAYSIGQRLLKDVEVQAAIQEAMQKRSKRVEITQDRVLQEYARIAFFDPRKLFEENGKPKDINALDDDTAAALAVLDEEERHILDRFYIHRANGNVERLCDELHVEVATVYRRRDKALRHFTLALYGVVET